MSISHVNQVPGANQVLIGPDRSFTFDYIYSGKNNQNKIYDESVKPLVTQFLDGYNVTIMAYGQTGSGKTYTMGTSSPNSVNELGTDNAGVIPRVFADIYSTLEKKSSQEQDFIYQIEATFVELYNDEIYDLLQFHKKKKRGSINRESGNFFEDEGQSSKLKKKNTKSSYQDSFFKSEKSNSEKIIWKNIEKRVAKDKHELIDYLVTGNSNRTTGSTDTNAYSSRSHAIFTITLTQQSLNTHKNHQMSLASINMEASKIVSKIHLVDLAGSERIKKANSIGDRMREGISINSGLLALGNVISALGNALKKQLHIPYRNSKLTRLLEDSLGGNSLTLMIACVTETSKNYNESLSTLRYANRARNIKNKVVVSVEKGGDSEVSALRVQIQQLKHQLEEQKKIKEEKKSIEYNIRKKNIEDTIKETIYINTRNKKEKSLSKEDNKGEIEMLEIKTDYQAKEIERLEKLLSIKQISGEGLTRKTTGTKHNINNNNYVGLSNKPGLESLKDKPNESKSSNGMKNDTQNNTNLKVKSMGTLLVDTKDEKPTNLQKNRKKSVASFISSIGSFSKKLTKKDDKNVVKKKNDVSSTLSLLETQFSPTSLTRSGIMKNDSAVSVNNVENYYDSNWEKVTSIISEQRNEYTQIINDMQSKYINQEKTIANLKSALETKLLQPSQTLPPLAPLSHSANSTNSLNKPNSENETSLPLLHSNSSSLLPNESKVTIFKALLDSNIEQCLNASILFSNLDDLTKRQNDLIDLQNSLFTKLSDLEPLSQKFGNTSSSMASMKEAGAIELKINEIQAKILHIDAELSYLDLKIKNIELELAELTINSTIKSNDDSKTNHKFTFVENADKLQYEEFMRLISQLNIADVQHLSFLLSQSNLALRIENLADTKEKDKLSNNVLALQREMDLMRKVTLNVATMYEKELFESEIFKSDLVTNTNHESWNSDKYFGSIDLSEFTSKSEGKPNYKSLTSISSNKGVRNDMPVHDRLSKHHSKNIQIQNEYMHALDNSTDHIYTARPGPEKTTHNVKHMVSELDLTIPYFEASNDSQKPNSNFYTVQKSENSLRAKRLSELSTDNIYTRNSIISENGKILANQNSLNLANKNPKIIDILDYEGSAVFNHQNTSNVSIISDLGTHSLPKRFSSSKSTRNSLVDANLNRRRSGPLNSLQKPSLEKSLNRKSATNFSLDLIPTQFSNLKIRRYSSIGAFKSQSNESRWSSVSNNINDYETGQSVAQRNIRKNISVADEPKREIPKGYIKSNSNSVLNTHVNPSARGHNTFTHISTYSGISYNKQHNDVGILNSFEDYNSSLIGKPVDEFNQSNYSDISLSSNADYIKSYSTINISSLKKTGELIQKSSSANKRLSLRESILNRSSINIKNKPHLHSRASMISLDKNSSLESSQSDLMSRVKMRGILQTAATGLGSTTRINASNSSSRWSLDLPMSGPSTKLNDGYLDKGTLVKKQVNAARTSFEIRKKIMFSDSELKNSAEELESNGSSTKVSKNLLLQNQARTMSNASINRARGTLDHVVKAKNSDMGINSSTFSLSADSTKSNINNRQFTRNTEKPRILRNRSSLSFINPTYTQRHSNILAASQNNTKGDYSVFSASANNFRSFKANTIGGGMNRTISYKPSLPILNTKKSSELINSSELLRSIGTSSTISKNGRYSNSLVSNSFIDNTKRPNTNLRDYQNKLERYSKLHNESRERLSVIYHKMNLTSLKSDNLVFLEALTDTPSSKLTDIGGSDSIKDNHGLNTADQKENPERNNITNLGNFETKPKSPNNLSIDQTYTSNSNNHNNKLTDTDSVDTCKSALSKSDLNSDKSLKKFSDDSTCNSDISNFNDKHNLKITNTTEPSENSDLYSSAITSLKKISNSNLMDSQKGSTNDLYQLGKKFSQKDENRKSNQTDISVEIVMNKFTKLENSFIKNMGLSSNSHKYLEKKSSNILLGTKNIIGPFDKKFSLESKVKSPDSTIIPDCEDYQCAEINTLSTGPDTLDPIPHISNPTDISQILNDPLKPNIDQNFEDVSKGHEKNLDKHIESSNYDNLVDINKNVVSEVGFNSLNSLKSSSTLSFDLPALEPPNDTQEENANISESKEQENEKIPIKEAKPETETSKQSFISENNETGMTESTKFSKKIEEPKLELSQTTNHEENDKDFLNSEEKHTANDDSGSSSDMSNFSLSDSDEETPGFSSSIGFQNRYFKGSGLAHNSYEIDINDSMKNAYFSVESFVGKKDGDQSMILNINNESNEETPLSTETKVPEKNTKTVDNKASLLPMNGSNLKVLKSSLKPQSKTLATTTSGNSKENKSQEANLIKGVKTRSSLLKSPTKLVKAFDSYSSQTSLDGKVAGGYSNSRNLDQQISRNSFTKNQHFLKPPSFQRS
ncbi:hypothetical protein BB559_007309 [Furculomyces boomerangus]|uniref:Kinesin motor domain-containing protein n=1 Tax=Furculomyces boomerangus TaxID=61424 RepID=A0A2T9XXX0_9FUNG|nr:hypothetical protein BB559_007309 [Furculomyces boomerangus]